MNGWAILLIVWFVVNAVLYVALIGNTLTFTRASAVTAFFLYAGLISIVFLATG